MFVLAAIAIGFLGSFHCVGMCGPIALAVPLKNNNFWSRLLGSLIYNSGRIITYSLLGMLFGLLGKGFVLAGWQNILSVTLGVLILGSLFLPKVFTLSGKTGFLYRIVEKLKNALRKLFGIHNYGSLLVIGILNGLLPCGLVYMGIAGSMATGSVVKGTLFMAGFGLGTFPAMMTVGMIRNLISISFRERIRKTVPIFVGIMAVLLILRGINLGIPYLSPKMVKTESGCHHDCCKEK